MEFWRDTGAELISRRGFEEDAELARAGGVPQLAERLGFDLADALAGEGERLSHFFERVLPAVFQPEAHLDDLFLARGERLQYCRGLLLKVKFINLAVRRDTGFVGVDFAGA